MNPSRDALQRLRIEANDQVRQVSGSRRAGETLPKSDCQDERAREHRGRERDPDRGQCRPPSPGLQSQPAGQDSHPRELRICSAGPAWRVARLRHQVRLSDELAVAELQDTIRDRRRVGLMGDDHDRPVLEVAQQRQHGAPALGVEIARRLVGEHELGIVDERPCDREPLLLAARELVREMVGDGREPQLVDQLRRASLTSRGCARETGREHHVLGAGELLDEMKGLEHEADVAKPRARELPRSLGGQGLPGDDDLARLGPIEPAEQM